MNMLREYKICRFLGEAGSFFSNKNTIFILFCLVLGLFVPFNMTAKADEPIIVVIDPGHGGENLGTEYEDYTEKDMTLIVAKAMKEELEQYDGIEVYLTRENDKDMTLEERCEYAVEKQADFLFCLHFNASENRNLFGAETWVSAFGEYYSKGYSFASIEISLLEEMGLYSRGIKTRLNDDGQDYYGIIRHATEKGLPCVLIEHCHLDNPNDQPFYDHKEKLEAFGRLDAEAVARYYGLVSESLGKNFSGYNVPSVPVPARTMKPDSTEPDICMIELVSQNMENGEVTISISAVDYDSGMLYYNYSYDGGETFSDLERWPDKEKDTFQAAIQVPSGTIPQIVVNAYNGYDLYTTSNGLNLPSTHYEEESGQVEDIGENDGRNTYGAGTMEEAAVESSSGDVLTMKEYAAMSQKSDAGTSAEVSPLQSFLLICLLLGLLVFTVSFSVILVLRGQKRKRRRGRRR